MSKLRIEVDDEGICQTFVDDQPVGVHHSLLFQMTDRPHLQVLIYDHPGYSQECRKHFKKLRYAEVFVGLLEEG